MFVLFYDWLIYVVLCQNFLPFLRPNSALLYESATFIHDGHLGPLHLLVIVKSAALTTGVQVSVRAPTLSSFGSVPRGGVAGSWG